MARKKYNNLLTSERWSNKDPKDSHILALVGVDHKLADELKKSSDKCSRDPTNGASAYIRNLPPCILGDPKGVVGNKTKDGN